jgi:RNA polymerase primary sigma factor
MELSDKNLATLNPREERIVRMLRGIGVNTKHSFEEVGLQFSITANEVKKIADAALEKLK